MRLNKIIQRDYTSFSLYYQIKLPLDLEISIPSDDPVRLVSAFVEEMDLSELYKTYGRIRKNQATPRQMLKLVIYAVMNRIYSSRDIQKACKRDINFMYLLEGMPAPDHATIARFISLHFSACAKVLLAQMSDLLYLLGEISGKTIFIDGMNRSIQAEGSFADVKEDMNFRRYLYRGKANALAESILLAMGRNINKLHCKIQTGRTGSYLFPLKRA